MLLVSQLTMIELVRERSVAAGYLDDALLKEKMLVLYGKGKGQCEFNTHQGLRNAIPAAANANLRRFEGMMGNVSWFMRLLKQRFAVWYNRTYGREGTLWSERFKSVLVEDSEAAIRTMAAYIDLNPVRAGLTDDPRTYRWCTIGAAMVGGQEFARAGLIAVYDTTTRTEPQAPAEQQERNLEFWPKVRNWWSAQLASEGEEVRDDDGNILKRGTDGKTLASLMKSSAGLAMSQLLRHRLRYLVDGGVIGSREFLQQIVSKERGRALPGDRKSEGTRMGKAGSSAIGGLYSLRNLQKL
jgi:putative transposase